MLAQDNIQMGQHSAIYAGYQVCISYEVEDSEWDTFLATTPGGHHVQSSLWAQVKSHQGWRAVRILIGQAGQIVGGVQLLFEPVYMAGAVAYVPRGPLFATSDVVAHELLLDKLCQVVKQERIQFLALQPPYIGGVCEAQLSRHGFRASSVGMNPIATVHIDLALDLDALLAQMKAGTRYNVRLSKRKGVTVREGTEDDLTLYHQLLVQTSERQDFAPYEADYFLKMWRIFKSCDYIRLFLAEFQGEIVSAQLVIAFGDTVVNKLSVWSGRHGHSRPNEALQWHTIRWAKAQGYRYYDLEGIDPVAAHTVLQAKPLPDAFKQTVTSFKLGFGGQVLLLPGVYDYFPHPVPRWLFRSVYPKVSELGLVKALVHRFRVR